MFTGLITQIGRIRNRRQRGAGGMTLEVDCGVWADPPRIGESIAVEGVCLTVATAAGAGFSAHLLRETVDRSTLGRCRSGDPVNLERALRAGDRLGGHLVSGHIDGQGACVAVRRAGPDYILAIQASAALLLGLVPKGSVACNGVSLTVVTVSADRFTVHVIPHTWQATTLQGLRAGSRINLETDLLGKYAGGDRGAGAARPTAGRLTLDDLRRSGFAD